MVLDTVGQLLNLPNLRVFAVDLTPAHLAITATSEEITAACPLCHTLSHRVHSCYKRAALDLDLRSAVCDVSAGGATLVDGG
jgi:hypothetical protein